MNVIEMALKKTTDLIRAKGNAQDTLTETELQLQFFAGYLAGAHAQKAEDDLKAEEWFRENAKGGVK